MSEAAPRVFLDTNVLFSGVYSRSGAPGRLLDAAAAAKYAAVISSAVIDELIRNLQRKSPAGLESLAAFLADVSPIIVANPPPEEVEPWLIAGLAEDAMVVAAASLAEVDYFCTGDAALLRKLATLDPPFRTIRPAVLLRILTGGGSQAL